MKQNRHPEVYSPVTSNPQTDEMDVLTDTKCLMDELMPPDPKHMGHIDVPHPHIIYRYPLETYRCTGEHGGIHMCEEVYGHMGASKCKRASKNRGHTNVWGYMDAPCQTPTMPASKLETSYLRLIPTPKELEE